MSAESPWSRFWQGICRDLQRETDRLACLRGLPSRTFPQALKAILLFIGVGLLVGIIIYAPGGQFQFLAPHIGTLLGGLLGFISGWGLFEIGEQRRRRIQQRTVREALKAELRNMEGVLNQMVCMFAWGADDPGRGVQEMRWYFSEGLKRSRLLDEPIPDHLSPEVMIE